MAVDELTALMERLENSPNPNLRNIGCHIRDVVTGRSELEVALGELRQMLEMGAESAERTAEGYEEQTAAIREELARVVAERDEARRELDQTQDRNRELNEQLDGFIKSPRLHAFDDHRDALEKSVEAALALARAAGDARSEREALEARATLHQLAELSWQRDRASMVVDEHQQSLLQAV